MLHGRAGEIIFAVADLIARPSGDTPLLAARCSPQAPPARVGFPRKPPVFLATGNCVNNEISGAGRLTNPEDRG